MVQLMPLPSIISCFIKIQNGLPFWCKLTEVVLEKRPLNGHSSSSISSSSCSLSMKCNYCGTLVNSVQMGWPLSRQCKITWHFHDFSWHSNPWHTYSPPTPNCVFMFYTCHTHIIVSAHYTTTFRTMSSVDYHHFLLTKLPWLYCKCIGINHITVNISYPINTGEHVLFFQNKFPLTRFFPDILLIITWKLQNSLTFPGFLEKWSPCTKSAISSF